ncbi:MAG: Yae1 family protein [Zavarzinella sp.]
MAKKKNKRKDFDSPWKELLDHYLEPVCEILFPNLHQEINWKENYKPLNTQLRKRDQEATSSNQHVDCLYEVIPISSPLPITLYLHVEVQSQHDTAFEERMLRYFIRLIDKYGANVRSVAILADPNPRWYPGEYALISNENSLIFRFQSFKILDFHEKLSELESQSSPVGLVLAGCVQNLIFSGSPILQRQAKINLTRNLIQRGIEREEIVNIFRLLDWMIQLPLEDEEKFKEEIQLLEEELRMPFLSPTEIRAIERGHKEGLEQGREQGLEQGREEGLLEGKAVGERIGKIHLLQELLHKKITPATRLQKKSLAELDAMIAELRELMAAD